ncbi:hypothetical protein SAMN03097694_2392 [Janthinobacterium lividum]|uniref:Lipoprotein n=1 Tax=Janthinobacterium lividum TaxID=29581 RepID=A0AB38C7F4_9BURK|nr:hypothetical protein [Janthinobacterium lividum]SFX47876.1 hypothetical protein SAMN03097694_2392 [Janthinobacterium lividum]
MIRHNIAALAIAFWCGLASCANTTTVSGNNRMAFGQARDVTIKNDNRSTNILQTQYTVYNLADVSKLNTLQRHQDALLIAEHPTKLIVASANFVQWTSDPELFLTITFSNVSKLPALKVEYGFSDQMHVGPSRAPRFVAIKHSSTVPKNRKLEYQIDPTEEILTPLISMSDLRKLLKLKNDYCIVMPRVLNEAGKFPSLHFKEGVSSTAIDYALPVAYIYRSIFEQKYIVNAVLSVIVAQRDTLMPPGPSDGDSYPRCRD